MMLQVSRSFRMLRTAHPQYYHATHASPRLVVAVMYGKHHEELAPGWYDLSDAMKRNQRPGGERHGGIGYRSLSNMRA